MGRPVRLDSKFEQPTNQQPLLLELELELEKDMLVMAVPLPSLPAL